MRVPLPFRRMLHLSPSSFAGGSLLSFCFRAPLLLLSGRTMDITVKTLASTVFLYTSQLVYHFTAFNLEELRLELLLSNDEALLRKEPPSCGLGKISLFSLLHRPFEDRVARVMGALNSRFSYILKSLKCTGASAS